MQKNKEKLKFFDNSPIFLADSNCLTAFGSKLNIDPSIQPMKNIIKNFDDTKDDYVFKLENL